MKRFLSVLVLVSLFSIALKAEVFGTAYPLAPKKMVAGGQAQVFFNPSEFMLFGDFGYGLMPKMEVRGFLGLGSMDLVLGGQAKYQFYRKDRYAVAVAAGLHLQNNIVLDIRPIGSHKFDDFTASAGLDFDFFRPNGDTIAMAIFGGVTYPLDDQIELVGDLGINVTKSHSWITAGGVYHF